MDVNYEYDYKEAIRDDCLDAIYKLLEDPKELEVIKKCENRYDLYDYFYDKLYQDDRVTGLNSGTYTEDKYIAESFLCHNMKLLLEARSENGRLCTPVLTWDPEGYDVTIRCYLLPEVLSMLLFDLVHEEFFNSYLGKKIKN